MQKDDNYLHHLLHTLFTRHLLHLLQDGIGFEKKKQLQMYMLEKDIFNDFLQEHTNLLQKKHQFCKNKTLMYNLLLTCYS